MDYKEKYEKALERAKKWCNAPNSDKIPTYANRVIEEIFPELKESEDEKIRRYLISTVSGRHSSYFPTADGFTREQILAWLVKQGELQTYVGNADTMRKNLIKDAIELAKQGEQNHVDKIESKFKVGDWVVVQGNSSLCQSEKLRQIEKVADLPDNHFQYWTTDGLWFGDGTESHLWTIDDAKDGDVLTYRLDNGRVLIMIYEGLGESFDGQVNVHALLDGDGYFDESAASVCCKFMELLTPATKKQRELFFQKMKEAGFEWDADKKVLVMIGIDNDDEQYEELEDDETDLSIEPINEYNTHEPTLEEAKEWNEAYEKGYSLGYENGKNEQNPAWSDEDEKYINDILAILGGGRGYRSNRQIEDWLKSLKPQPQWKPTDEQMENLEYAINMVDKCCEDSLQSLYNDLKKL